MEKEQIIKLWKELGVEQVILEFDCGGDSMGSTDWTIETAKGSIDNQEIEDYFDNEVYNNVDFYVNSDGHYQGEAGQVIIELVEDDEEPYFSYSKQAESEWSESITNDLEIKLTEKEAEFIKKNIINFNGDEGQINSVFNGDLFLSDEDEAFLNELEQKILDEVQDFSPEIDEGELEEWFNFNTEENNLTINDNNELVVEVNNRIRVFRDSD
jgi:hypothetical protein